MRQCKKIKQNGNDQQILISVSSLFLAAMTSVLFLEGRLGSIFYISNQL